MRAWRAWRERSVLFVVIQLSPCTPRSVVKLVRSFFTTENTEFTEQLMIIEINDPCALASFAGKHSVPPLCVLGVLRGEISSEFFTTEGTEFTEQSIFLPLPTYPIEPNDLCAFAPLRETFCSSLCVLRVLRGEIGSEFLPQRHRVHGESYHCAKAHRKLPSLPSVRSVISVVRNGSMIDSMTADRSL